MIWATLIAGVGIRCFVRFSLGFPKGPLGIAFDLWGLCPYIALALVSKHIKQRVALLVTAVALVGTDLSASREAIYGTASTSAVALGVQPLFAILVVIPLALLVSKTLDAYFGSPPMTSSTAENEERTKKINVADDGDESRKSD